MSSPCLQHRDLDFIKANESISMLAVCKGAERDCEALMRSLGTEVPFILDPQSEVSELYGIANYPVAVVVDAARRIRGYGYPQDARSLQVFVTNAFRQTGVEFTTGSATSVARHHPTEVASP